MFGPGNPARCLGSWRCGVFADLCGTDRGARLQHVAASPDGTLTLTLATGAKIVVFDDSTNARVTRYTTESGSSLFDLDPAYERSRNPVPGPASCIHVPPRVSGVVECLRSARAQSPAICRIEPGS
jgi:hypothetical protein